MIYSDYPEKRKFKSNYFPTDFSFVNSRSYRVALLYSASAETWVVLCSSSCEKDYHRSFHIGETLPGHQIQDIPLLTSTHKPACAQQLVQHDGHRFPATANGDKDFESLHT